MRRCFLFAVAGLLSLASQFTEALEPQKDALFARAVDIGGGLCCVIKIPGSSRDHYIIYDAGNFEDSGHTAFKAIMELIPLGSTVDLLVLSHSDADHIDRLADEALYSETADEIRSLVLPAPSCRLH